MTPEERQRPLTIADLTIDIGATSKEEVIETYKIDLGAPVIPDVTCCYNEQTDLFRKAFDCRIGCACLVDVMEELKEETLPFASCDSNCTRRSWRKRSTYCRKTSQS